MPGRRNPEPTESEMTREYRLAQKRGYGEAAGEGLVPDEGAVAEVKREREEWKEGKDC